MNTSLQGYIFIFLLLATAVGSSVGLDFKKWWSWLFVIAGFLLGLIMPIISENSNSVAAEELCLGVFLGIIFSTGVLLGGWVMRRHKDKL